MPVNDLTLVDRHGALAPALGRLSGHPVVGVDVERSDWDRYYRAAALVQVGAEGVVVLVDPLALDDLSPLEGFLSERRAVLHACENDLEPLAALGVRPPCVEDTAIAAAVLGYGTGLESLLSDVVGVELATDKAAMQRADWEARPLPEPMQSYAGADVADLPALWEALERRLADLGRLDWYRQEVEATLAQPPAEVRREWTRTKGAGRLDRGARARLEALWETREQLGRDTDTAPGRIATDKVLVDLAASPPRGVGELGRRGVRRQSVKRFGPALIAALAAPAGGVGGVRSERRRPATEQDRALAERLRSLRAERARQLAIDPGVLCPSRTLVQALLTDPRTPADLRDALGLRPWQWAQLGAAFCDALGLDGKGTPPPVTPAKEDKMTDVLNPDALHHGLDTLDGWTGTLEGIEKTYTFADFAEAMRFVRWVADLAEDMNHHPDIHVSWNRVTLSLVTHSAGGVTQRDLDMAARLDEIPHPGSDASAS